MNKSKFPVILAKFLAKNKIKKNQLAIDIQVSKQTISGWLWNDIMPNLESARRLVEYSNGYITLKDCGYEA